MTSAIHQQQTSSCPRREQNEPNEPATIATQKQQLLGREPDSILDDSAEMNASGMDSETDMNLQHLLRATNHLKIA